MPSKKLVFDFNFKIEKQLNEEHSLQGQQFVLAKEVDRVSKCTDKEMARGFSRFLVRTLLSQNHRSIRKQIMAGIRKIARVFPGLDVYIGHTFLDLAEDLRSPETIISSLSKTEIQEIVKRVTDKKLEDFVRSVIEYTTKHVNSATHSGCFTALSLMETCLNISSKKEDVVISSILKPLITMTSSSLIQHRIQTKALRMFVSIVVSKPELKLVLLNLLSSNNSTNKNMSWIQNLDYRIRVTMTSMILNHCKDQRAAETLANILVEALESTIKPSSCKLDKTSSNECVKGLTCWLSRTNISQKLVERIMKATLTLLNADVYVMGTNDMIRHMLRLEICREKMLRALLENIRISSKTSIAAACVALDVVKSVDDAVFCNTTDWVRNMIQQIVLGQRALSKLLIAFIVRSNKQDWIDPLIESLRASSSSDSVVQDRILCFLMPSLVRKISKEKFRVLLSRLGRATRPSGEIASPMIFSSWGQVETSSCRFTMRCVRYGMSGFEHVFVSLLYMGMEENKLNVSEIDSIALGTVRAQIRNQDSCSERIGALRTSVSMLRYSKTILDVTKCLNLIRDFLHHDGLEHIQESEVAVCERLWELLRDRLRHYIKGNTRRRKSPELLDSITKFVTWLAREWIPRVVTPNRAPETLTTCLNLCSRIFELNMWSVSDREIFLSALVRCVPSKWKQVRYASANLLSIVLSECQGISENKLLLHTALRLGSSLEQRKSECGGAIVSLVCCLFDPKTSWPSNSDLIVPHSFSNDIRDIETQMQVSIKTSSSASSLSSSKKKKDKNKNKSSLNSLVTFVRQRLKEMISSVLTKKRQFPCAHGLVFAIRDMCIAFGLTGIATCSARIRNELYEPEFSFLLNDDDDDMSSHKIARRVIKALSDIPLKSGNVNANDKELEDVFGEERDDDDDEFEKDSSYEKQVMSSSWLVVKEALITLQVLFRSQSSFKLQPENIAELLLCTLFRTSHDGILTETQNALQDLSRNVSSSQCFEYSTNRLDDVLKSLECLLNGKSNHSSKYDFNINFTTLRRSAGFPLAVVALTSFCKGASQFQVSVPRLLDVARTERSYDNQNVVSAVVCATNALRVMLGTTESSFHPFVGPITSLAIRNLKSRNYSIRASALHLYGVAIRKVLGSNIVKWAPRAIDAPCVDSIEQKYPRLVKDVLNVMQHAVRTRSQPTDLVASLVFLRRLDVSRLARTKISEIERSALHLARHAQSWRVRAKASDALCSISSSRMLCNIILEETRALDKIECVVSSQGIVRFRDTNRVHGSLLILKNVIEEMFRRDVEELNMYRDMVAKSLKCGVWFKSDAVLIASEVISSAFWDLIATVTLPNAVKDHGVIGTDLVRDISIGLSNVSPPYCALGTRGSIDRIQGGWHSDTWCAVPDDLLRRNTDSKDVLRRTLMWKKLNISSSEELRIMACRIATKFQNFKRARSLDLESVSMIHFYVRSMLLDRVVSKLNRSSFTSALCEIRSISPVASKNVNGILELFVIRYGSNIARSVL